MICRLCLNRLSETNSVFLFENNADSFVHELPKLIAKYLDLELFPDDSVSTRICQTCCAHLEDFHQFCQSVQCQQSTLRNEFLALDIVKNETKIKAEAEAEIAEEPLLELVQMDFNLEQTDSLGGDEFAAGSKLACSLDSADEHIESDENIPLATLKTQPMTSKTKKKPLANRKLKTKKSLRVRQNKTTKAKDTVLKKTGPTHMSVGKNNEEIISNFMQLACNLCDKFAGSYKELRKHFNMIHQQGPFVMCCGIKYNNQSKLAEHITWHTNPDAFKCDICQKVLRDNYGLKLHKAKVHTEKHETDFACSICGQKYMRKKSLESHLLNRHKDKLSELKLDAELENAKHNEFVCEICNKSFPIKQRLQRHIIAMHDTASQIVHVCDICGKKFKFKPSFEQHLREHQGIVEQPEQCDICFKWLKSKHGLRTHRFKHDKVDVHCNECGRKCPTRRALLSHIAYMHKREKNHRCTFCEKTFKKPENLAEHMAMHTGAQLYSCPHCVKHCRSRANMYVHIKRAHYEEWLKTQEVRSKNPSAKSVSTQLAIKERGIELSFGGEGYK